MALESVSFGGALRQGLWELFRGLLRKVSCIKVTAVTNMHERTT